MMDSDGMKKPILCLDFDGVIHSYTTQWLGATVIPDPPVPGAFEFIAYASPLFDVQIYSSRSKEQGGIDAMYQWMIEYAGPAKLVTFCHEKPPAFLTIDDRAICFDGDWSKLDPEELLKFKPWNKT